ncbi:hypothetical protein CYMTET_21429 [Cymbomonas tetramitiformis]|uniref:Uncharacterized protein n=1 Tax=Cymbomonas tetramitiformis TaxID=36881 RepID=A0AAE0G2E3_9CHLO|nr:hypothetical protein CYMTET_21429 [Cymbomonas tetramitiformis]
MHLGGIDVQDSDDEDGVVDNLGGGTAQGGSVVSACRAAPPPGLPPSLRTTALPLLAVCMLFAFGATAEPLTGSAVGGVSVIDPVDFFDLSLTATASSNVDGEPQDGLYFGL